MLNQMDAEGTIDIFNFVRHMRFRRNYMVQTSVSACPGVVAVMLACVVIVTCAYVTAACLSGRHGQMEGL